jgi:predicted permease
VLVGAMALVLLIGCVNIATLMLARATSRTRELAVRKALGASQSRLAWQLLVEAGLLAMIGGILGLVLAFWIVPVMVAAVPEGMPRLDEVRVDGAAFAFTLTESIITALLFGTLPAIRGSRVDVRAMLTEGRGRERMGGRRSSRSWSPLVATELAFAFVLLTGALLLLNSFTRLTLVPSNYEAESVFALNVGLPPFRYVLDQGPGSDPATSTAAGGVPRRQETAFVRAALERLNGLPGVDAAVAVTRPPGTAVWGPIAQVRREDEPAPTGGQARWEVFRAVSHDYFKTLRVPLRAGRTFTAADDDVAVISEALARDLWPDRDAVGERLIVEQAQRSVEVVDVVADVLEAGYGSIAWLSQPQRTLYMPYDRWGVVPGGMAGWRMSKWFLVRGNSPPDVLIPALRRAIWDVDPELPITQVSTQAAMVSDGMLPYRALTTVLLAVGLLGILLAATGVYGLTSFSVASRTREIGIRIALGATPGRVGGMLLRRTAVIGAVGIGVGAAGALALARFLQGMLYGVQPGDPLTLVLVSVFLMGISVLATLLPARRVARIDPMATIRHQ